ncbi:DUF6314 family protein [Aestuariivita boseongensis]|uniref:DUF6314 family protein n=1 Tax=Aestuariivita boseongensis TaxID=1470562 RepID=UPI0006836F6D|nr:DUF6314 family protein [Aestuariivita boseongensis]
MTKPRQITDFEGRWTLTRWIVHADGTKADFTGEARFEPNDTGGLAYLEDGHLTLPTGQQMRATRAYRWEADLSVFFDDGRPFHQVPAEGGEAVHLCPPDTYRVTYDFTEWPQWQAVWQVTGPRKDYVMTSVYTQAR